MTLFLVRSVKYQNHKILQTSPLENEKNGLSFAFGGNKRNEVDDGSMQIMHIQPLVEYEMRHNAANVRFGHRWCNVAMTDHSIEETVDFMEYIVKAHKQ